MSIVGLRVDDTIIIPPQAGSRHRVFRGSVGKFAERWLEVGKGRTHPIRVDVIRQIMADKNIRISDLVDATRMSRKGITNILNKKNEPMEDNLVLIAAVLGVKWTTLVEGYEGDIEKESESGGVSVITSVRYVVDLRNGVSPEDAIRKLTARFAKSLNIADEIHISILRESE